MMPPAAPQAKPTRIFAGPPRTRSATSEEPPTASPMNMENPDMATTSSPM